jgi:DeoR/GlpR family transcriptional regulator of sugar metabolism
MKNKKERLSGIIATIRGESTTTIDLLAAKFGVSTATIRRDVKLLENSGQVIQTIGGGVVYNKDYLGPSREDSLVTAIDEKVRIAEYCSTLIAAQDTVIIGPGVLPSLSARIFSGLDLSFRIITNSISLAYELEKVPNINLYVIGGEIEDDTAVKTLCSEPLSGVKYADKLFITADGISASHGLTFFNARQIQIMKEMMQVAREVILIADSSKFGKVCFNFLDSLDSVTRIITDDKIQKNSMKLISAQGIELITV